MENQESQPTAQSPHDWTELQRFSTRADAWTFYQILCENHYSCCVFEDPHQPPDPLRLRQVNQGPSQVSLQVFFKDLDAARRVLETVTQEEQQFDDNDYLTHFSDDDLQEILRKPDEWSLLDYDAAIKILGRRGIRFSDTQLQRWKEERLAELSQPIEPSAILLIMAYAGALLGGLVGLLMAWQLGWHNKRLPDGRLVPAYTRRGKIHARAIAGLSLFGIALLAWILRIFQ